MRDHEQRHGDDRSPAGPVPAGTTTTARSPGGAGSRLRLSPGTLLDLQRRAGNAAVAGVVQRTCDGPGSCGCQRCGGEEDEASPSPVAVQRQKPPAAPPEPGVVPPGYSVKHNLSRLRFTDQAPEVRRTLEAFLAERNDLKALDLFDSDGEFVGPVPVIDIGPGGCDLNPATCTRYRSDVVRIVRDEVRGLRSRVTAFQDDFERRGADTLYLLLDDSEEKINREKERYGLQKKEGTFSFLLGADYSMGAAPDLTAAAQALLDKYLEVKTAAAALAKCTDLGGTLPPGGVDAMCPDEDRVRAEGAVKEREKDYSTLRKQKEAVHPILITYDLSPQNAATHGTLATLASASGDTKAELLYDQIAEKLGNIKTTRDHTLGNRACIWKLDTVVGVTQKLPDIAGYDKLPTKELQAIAIDDAKSRVVVADLIKTAAIAALGVALGLIAGPLGAAGMQGLAAAAVATDVGLGVAQTLSAIRQYEFEQAATNTDLDTKARSISQEEPSLFWLALDIVMTVAQLKAAADEFRGLMQLSRSATAAKAAKSESAEKLLDDLRERGEKVKPGVGDRLRREADQLGSTVAGDAAEIAANLGKVTPLGSGGYTHEIAMGGGRYWRRTAEGRWCHFASPPRCPLGVSDWLLSPTLAGLSPETNAALMSSPDVLKLAEVDVRVGVLLERHGVDGVKAMTHAPSHGEDPLRLLQRFDDITDIEGSAQLLKDLAAGSSTTRGAIGELYIIEQLLEEGVEIERIAHVIGGKKAADILLRDRTVIDVKYYDWTRWYWKSPRLTQRSAAKLAAQVARRQKEYPKSAIVYVFAGGRGDIPPAIVTALESAGAVVSGSL